MSKQQTKDLEFELYQRMCAGCEYERRCHVQCETCEDFEDRLQELAAEEYFKNQHRLKAKKIIKEGNCYYCPNCKKLIGKHPYCKYCGQALEV